MSKNLCRLLGLLMQMVSLFLILGGLFLPSTALPSFVSPLCLLAGFLLLATGLVFYKVLKSDE